MLRPLPFLCVCVVTKLISANMRSKVRNLFTID